MLLPRILTAIVGIPIVVSAIHLGGFVYMTLIACVIALSLYEYGLVLRLGKKPVQSVPLFVFGAVVAITAFLIKNPDIGGKVDNILPFAIILSLTGVMFWEVITPNRSLERPAFTFFGIFFIPWTLAYLVNIREIHKFGEFLTYMLFITVWISDSAAYFVGKKIGERKLAKDVSPKKTWEGAFAGLVSAVIVAVILKNLLFPYNMSLTSAIVLGIVIAVMGQISDLAESLIKRSVGVKDSSNLLPGHGGVLDRFDSYLLLAPVFYYLALLFLTK
jgi:phosphatidate cytidylyltransferase